MTQGNITSSNMDDLMRELMSYSEFSRPDDQEDQRKPESIERYHNIVAENDNVSIFDVPFNPEDLEDEAQSSNTNNNKPKNKVSDLLDELSIIENDKLTYASNNLGRGRARGQDKYCLKPGPQHLSNEEDISRRIQQSSGLGYSNALIEANIKAAQRAKTLEKIKNKSPQGSKTSSSGIKTPKSGGKSPKSGYSSPNKGIQVESPTKVDSSLGECEVFSNASTDSYHTIQESSKEMTSDENNDLKLIEIEEPTVYKELVQPKPLPLSQMLKIGRAEQKLKRIQLNPMAQRFEPPNELLTSNSSITNSTGQHLTESEAEELSQKLISKLLREDKIELAERRNAIEKKQKIKQQQAKQRQLQQYTNWLNRNDPVNPTSSSSSSDEGPPWRRRSDSPPRFPWGSKSLKPLNISSVDEFPQLK